MLKVEKPNRISKGAWHGHMIFAQWIVRVLHPKLFVELGTHNGDSYFSFCQSVLKNNLMTQCHAIDTWKGEEQAGFYDESVYNEVNAYNERLYSDFSTLHRCYFDNAIDYFENDSIDLLHIDGFHTYEAVKRDFNNWKKKLSKNAIVLFHDVSEVKQDFGVWKFWNEIEASYPGRTFSFLHSHGLGILGIGDDYPSEILTLFDTKKENIDKIRVFFENLNYFLIGKEDEYRSFDKNKKFKVYIDSGTGYSENEVESIQVEEISGNLEFSLSSYNNISEIRLDFSRRPKLILIKDLSIELSDGSIIHPEVFGGTFSVMVPLVKEFFGEGCLLLFTTLNPRLYIKLQDVKYTKVCYHYEILGFEEIVFFHRIKELEKDRSHKIKENESNISKVSALNRHIAELEQELKQKRLDLAKSEEGLSLLEVELGVKCSQLQDKDSQIEEITEKHREVIILKNYDLQNKEDKIGLLKENINQLKKQITQLDLEIKKRVRDIEAKDIHLLDLKEMIDELKKSNAKMTNRLIILGDELEEAKIENKNLEKKIDKDKTLSNINEKLNQELNYLIKTIDKKDSDIIMLNDVIINKDKIIKMNEEHLLDNYEINKLLISIEREKLLQKKKKLKFFYTFLKIIHLVFHLKNDLRHIKEKRVIDKSGLFCYEYYFQKNRDLFYTVDLLEHFIANGSVEGRNPSILFDLNYYVNNNSDIIEKDVNPLFHFCISGWKEFRNPHTLFDTKYYIKTNKDVLESELNPLTHYYLFGHLEQRDPHPLFDVKYYINSNNDFIDKSINPLFHFISVGYKNGFNPNPLFDIEYYLCNYEDIRKNDINPLEHYINYGWREGRDPHPLFDTSYYVENNDDIKESGINPLEHFLYYGWKEGRNPHPLFNTQYYLDNNEDVRISQVNPLLHFISYGHREGRNPHPLFDIELYISKTPELGKSKSNPLIHFCSVSLSTEVSPHPLFAISYYRKKYYIKDENPLVHYLVNGHRNKMKPHPLFDSAYYINNYPNYSEAHYDPLSHFCLIGHKQNYNPNMFFDVEFYKKQNVDPQMNPLVHYVNIGWKNGLNPSNQFNTNLYIELYPDVKKSGHCPLIHFIEHGIHEKRQLKLNRNQESELIVNGLKSLNITFDPELYLELNPDVMAANVDPFEHFILHGLLEQRRFNNEVNLSLLNAYYFGNLNIGSNLTVFFNSLKDSDLFLEDIQKLDVTDEMKLIIDDEKHFISIIMPTWNRANVISDSINSIINQSYKKWELIIVDDGSTDGSVNLIENKYSDYIQKNKIRIIHSDHNGVSRARNIGMENASGDFFAYLDSDNSWNSNYLIYNLLFLLRHNSCWRYNPKLWIGYKKRANLLYNNW